MKKDKTSPGIYQLNFFLNLCIRHQIEDSYRKIDYINLKIAFYNLQLEYLIAGKPLFFERKKLREYVKTKSELENKIIDCHKEIEVELGVIKKMKSSISI